MLKARAKEPAKAKESTKAQRLVAMQGLLARKFATGAVGNEAVLQLAEDPDVAKIRRMVASGEIEPDVGAELEQALDG